MNRNPSPSTRFPVNRQDHTKKGPYLTPLLKRLLEKKINFEDPETRKMIKGKVKDAIIWRLILNATQGENQAINTILERMDGKVVQALIGEGFSSETKIIVINPSDYKKDRLAGDLKEVSG